MIEVRYPQTVISELLKKRLRKEKQQFRHEVTCLFNGSFDYRYFRIKRTHPYLMSRSNGTP